MTRESRRCGSSKRSRRADSLRPRMSNSHWVPIRQNRRMGILDDAAVYLGRDAFFHLK